MTTQFTAQVKTLHRAQRSLEVAEHSLPYQQVDGREECEQEGGQGRLCVLLRTTYWPKSL
jgi:hypothetical protein